MTKKRFVSFDWVIKYMLRDKSNYVIVEGFLSELLKQPIKIQQILESEANKETSDDKYNRVDVLVKTSEGELIIIELQYDTEFDYFHRILYGTSKLITEYISEGEPYAKIKKIISVSLVYFDLGIGDDYLYHGTTTFRGLHKHDTLQLNLTQKQRYQCANIVDIYPEYYLIKVKKFTDEINEKLDEWVYFLKHENILESFTAQGLHEAKEKLDRLKLPEKERRAYETYMENLRYKKSIEETQHWEGYLAGYQKGEETGYQKSQLELAKKLLNSPMDIDEQAISDLTGLSLEQIKTLQNNSSK